MDGNTWGSTAGIRPGMPVSTLQGTGQPPTKNYQAPNVSSAEVRNSPSGCLEAL